jgi:hypothetical protein
MPQRGSSGLWSSFLLVSGIILVSVLTLLHVCIVETDVFPLSMSPKVEVEDRLVNVLTFRWFPHAPSLSVAYSMWDALEHNVSCTYHIQQHGSRRAQKFLIIFHRSPRKNRYQCSQRACASPSLIYPPQMLFSDQLPDLSPAYLAQIAQMLGRQT